MSNCCLCSVFHVRCLRTRGGVQSYCLRQEFQSIGAEDHPPDRSAAFDWRPRHGADEETEVAMKTEEKNVILLHSHVHESKQIQRDKLLKAKP